MSSGKIQRSRARIPKKPAPRGNARAHGAHGADAGLRGRYQIEIVRRSRLGRLPGHRIRQVIEHVLRRHRARSCELEVVILGSAAMATLNQRWLRHEGATDNITFDLADEPASRTKVVAGQINVCWPIARKQAARRSHAAETELLLYVVHGLLHLLGYDDHDPKAAVRMHNREDEMFEQLGFGRVYSASSGKGAR